jgi:hypothetical protein
MNKNISTIEELQAERARLTLLLAEKKAHIRQDLFDIKAEFQPALNVANKISNLFSPKKTKNTLLNQGTRLTLDIILGKLLGGSNILVRTIVPSIFRKYSSVVTDNVKPLIKTITDKLFHRKKQNKIEPHYTYKERVTPSEREDA